MLWLQHDLLNRHHDMQNFHRDELFLQHDLNERNTIYFLCIRQQWRVILPADQHV